MNIVACLARNAVEKRKKEEKRGSGSVGLLGVEGNNICKRKGGRGLTAVLFQPLDKFYMLTCACFLYNAFHFFGK